MYFREALLIITIFTNSDYLGDILSHRDNFHDDFEAIRKFISWYSKFTHCLISIIICNGDITIFYYTTDFALCIIKFLGLIPTEL